MQVIKPNTLTNTNGSFIDGSFTRSTTGTYVDFDGLIKSAAIDVLRYNYNPSSLIFEGALIEKAATNVAIYSEQFDNATWVKNNVTIVANNTVAPDGLTTADKLEETATTGLHYLNSGNFSFTVGLRYSYSVFVKAGTRSQVRLQLNTASFGADTYASFDLATASVINTANAPEASIVEYEDGWYRCSISATATATASSNAFVMAMLGGAVSYLGVLTDGLFLWGAQVEQSPNPTSYIPTVATSVLRAADIVTGSGYITSNLTDATAVWSSGTTYAAAAIVRYLGFRYQSIAGSNLNNAPDVSPTLWIKLGPDNFHAAIDNSVSTASSTTTELTLTIKPGKIDSIALINIEGATIEIAVTDYQTGEVFYNNTYGLSGENVQDWFQYFFFDPITQRTQIIATNINSTFPDGVVSIRIKGGVGATVSLGSALFGLTTTLGQTQMGAQVGIIDYSRKDTDPFGTTTFVERAFSKRMSVDLFFANSQLNNVQRFLYSIRATPVVWVATDDPTYEEALVVYGFYKDFSTTIAYPSTSLCSLEIEGLI